MSAPILVVDDMPYIREPMAAALRLAGHDALSAATGPEALSLIYAHRPALVLLDLEMPGMSGLDLLRRLQLLPPEDRPRVIVLTASQDRSSVVAAGKLGVADFLLKSTFSLAQLLKRVKAVLEEASPVPAAEASAGSSRAGPPPATPGASEPASPLAALEALEPLATREAVLRAVERAGDLRAFSPAVAEVLQACDDPGATAETIAAAIKRDPALALKVLKLANSSAYTVGRKTASVDEAVVRIGTGAIRQTLLNIGVIDNFSPQGRAGAIDRLQFWEHSIACGLIAAELERATGGTAPDEAFTLGLLHDVGRLVLARQLGGTYGRVVDAAARCGAPLERAESRLLGLTHAEIMPAVLRQWNLPASLVEPIATHHAADPREHDAPARERLVLRLADRLAHALLMGASGNETLCPLGGLVARLGLDEATLRRIARAAHEQARDVKLALLSTAATADWPDQREVWRARLAAPVRPLCVGTSGAAESVHLACEALAPDSEGRPNVGVVFADPGSDRRTLEKLWRDACGSAGVRDLPVVLVCQEAGDAGAGWPGVRAVLTTPVAMGALVAGLNKALGGAPAARAA